MIDPKMLLQQIFGKQAAQPMQISCQTGMGPTGPSKFQQFGSLLQLLGGTGAATMNGTTPPAPNTNNQQAADLLKSLFGGMGGRSGTVGSGGGRREFSGDGMTQSRRGGIY